ncbi:hypothetical protein ABZP36_000441 [Zizania latifolia]
MQRQGMVLSVMCWDVRLCLFADLVLYYYHYQSNISAAWSGKTMSRVVDKQSLLLSFIRSCSIIMHQNGARVHNNNKWQSPNGRWCLKKNCTTSSQPSVAHTCLYNCTTSNAFFS